MFSTPDPLPSPAAPAEKPEEILGRLLAVRAQLSAQIMELKVRASAVDEDILSLTGRMVDVTPPAVAGGGATVMTGPKGRHALCLKHPGTGAFVAAMKPTERLNRQESLVLHALVDAYLGSDKPVPAVLIAAQLGYAAQTVAVTLSWLRSYGFPEDGDWTIDIPGNGEYKPCPKSACAHPPQRRRLPRAGRKAA